MSGWLMFDDAYVDSLATFKLSPYKLKRVGKNYELTFKGPWRESSRWETIALAIVSELISRAYLRQMSDADITALYSAMYDRLYRKLSKLAEHPSVKFIDFGQRRRHSFLWQKLAGKLARQLVPAQFVGTSNTWMAAHHDVEAKGTNAHELFMVFAALASSDSEKEFAESQFRVLDTWESVYDNNLRVLLPDTFGSAQFYKKVGPRTLRDWSGIRQDSGDPVAEGELYISWLKKSGVDPMTKMIIFSDGLDVDEMIRLENKFRGKIGSVSFGWGTLLTNDSRNALSKYPQLRPYSIVCKPVSANGRPCVKLSNNINKATGPQFAIDNYVRVFHNVGRIEQEVIV